MKKKTEMIVKKIQIAKMKLILETIRMDSTSGSLLEISSSQIAI